MAQAQEFARYVGYDSADSFRSFLINSYISAQKNGLFFKEKLPAAVPAEISQAAAYAAANIEDAGAIAQSLERWLSGKGFACTAADIAAVMLRALSDCGANKKNTYYLLLSWMVKYLGKKPSCILYIGAPSMKELFFLYIANIAGVGVTAVTYGRDPDFTQFAFGDKIRVCGGKSAAPIQIDFSKLDLSKEEKLSQMKKQGELVKDKVKRLDTTAAGIFEDFLKDRKTRVTRNGGVYTEDGELPVYFAALIGYDDDAVYTNMLVKFKESFAGLKKQLIFIEKPLSNPNAEEVKALGAITRTSTGEMIDALALLINLGGDPTRTALAQNALRELLNSLYNGNQTVVFNYGTKIITWLYRCTQARKYAVNYEDIPVILYYGDISQSELYFLNFMSRCGFDVIYITPNKDMLKQTGERNIDSRMQIFELPQSKESGSYPDKPIKMKVATVAYSAERELDTMLYGGDAGIYRSFQFPNSQSLTLKTTYEEIGILWKQEARFRTGFSTSGNLVCVPNIFAKISGVQDGRADKYWDEVRERLTPETILKVKKQGEHTDGNLDLSAYRDFYRNGEINIEKLKGSTLNKYGYLPDRIQDMLFCKLQEAVSCGFLKVEGDELMCAVLHFGLGFDKDFLKLVQRFDFTKSIPKLIYIDVVEDTFTLEECVKIVLCNLIGFDVLIYTPTGYKNLETYIKSEAFEEHIMNEFLYNMEVPKFKIPSDDKNSGLFGKLFRKG